MEPVINQRSFPGVGDIDDCAVIATYWAAVDSGLPADRLPTVRAFRAAAGVPDLPGQANGLTQSEVVRGIDGTSLRTLPHPLVDEPAAGVSAATLAESWAVVTAALEAGRPMSVAVLSSLLPRDLQFGFRGWHRVGIVGWPAAYLANPLADEGSAPVRIDGGVLRRAMAAVGRFQGVAFPVPRAPGRRRHAFIAPPGTDVYHRDGTVLGHVSRAVYTLATGRHNVGTAKAPRWLYPIASRPGWWVPAGPHCRIVVTGG